MDSSLILLIVGLDFLMGDPRYALHPIRLMGNTLRWMEGKLFDLGLKGYTGGIVLLGGLLAVFAIPVWIVQEILTPWPWLQLAWQVFWGFHCLALRDLFSHVQNIARAARAGNEEQARQATSLLVGRDTHTMDKNGCCRAGIESLAENLVDGVISPLFWGLLLGIPGMVAFKVVSTMDSMVGYRTERYLRFGWAGARLDDFLNWIPARLTWLITGLAALILPGYQGRKAWKIGLKQWSLVPGPNAGWSETAFAGALGRRLAGPIYQGGVLVNNTWLGCSNDHPATLKDINRALGLALTIYGIFLGGALLL